MWLETMLGLPKGMGNAIVIYGQSLLMILTCLFCWLRGARSDRIAAAVFAIVWVSFLATFAIWTTLTGDPRQQFLLTVTWDVIPGGAFLYLAIRYSNLWYGAAAMAQGVQFALNALEYAVREPFGTAFPVILIFSANLLNLVMMAAMIGSTLSAIGLRRSPTGMLG